MQQMSLQLNEETNGETDNFNDYVRQMFCVSIYNFIHLNLCCIEFSDYVFYYYFPKCIKKILRPVFFKHVKANPFS